MRKVREEIIQRERGALSSAVKKGRVQSESNASQVVVECCLDAVAEQQAKHQFEVLYEKILKRFEGPTLLRTCQER